MLLRLFVPFALALLMTAPMVAQETGEDPEPVPIDSTYYPEDTTGYYSDTTDYGQPIDTSYTGYDDYGNGEMPTGSDSFVPGGGFYVGPTFEFTALSPAALDPALDGDLVLYGVQLYAIINGWMLGGHWSSATLYDMSANYDAFELSYGGFLTGYDLTLVGGLSFRLSALIGGGDLNMIKKRPDLRATDTTGNEILERYRTESFFLLRPGASLGYSPLPFLDLRLGVDFPYPIGGDEVHDLKKATYGLHVMFGAGKY